MTLRKRYLPLVALLGAAIAVLPTVASSATSASVNAISSLPYPYWSPTPVALMPTAVVTFANSSATVLHGIIWQSTPATPTCDSSVPVGVGNFGTSWTGGCTFTQAGTYTYYCSYHGLAMSGTIYVNAAGTVPVTATTPPPTNTTPPPTNTTPPPTNTTPSPTTTQPQPPAPTPTVQTTATASGVDPTQSTGSAATLGDTDPQQASIATASLVIAKTQHGSSVRGSAKIAASASGARMQVDLLTKSASTAHSARSTQISVGKLVRSSVRAGKISFSVPLNAAGKRSLRLHGHLTLTVRVTLTPANGGSSVSSSRNVVVRH